jgi:adenylate cyclase
VQTTAQDNAKVKRPIGAKLIAIITILVLVSLGVITALVSILVSSDVRVTAEENNFTINKRSAAEAEIILGMVRSSSLVLLDTLNAAGSSAALSRQASGFFFERNQDIAAIVIAQPSGRQAEPLVSNLLVNTRFFLANEIEPSLVESFLAARADAVEKACAGEALILNAAPIFGIPALAMLYPWQGGGALQAVVIIFSAESLTDTFGAGVNATFMINGSSDILVHADAALVKSGANVGNQAFIRSVEENREESLQTLYTGEDGLRYFGAFTRLSVANAAVITTVPYDVVFEGVAATTRRNIYLTAAVLCLSILFIWFFSKTISGPLKTLTEAAGRIKNGEFEIELTAKSKDEIGLLTDSFVEMGRGLAERERLKDTFGRFTNKEIAERAMRGDLALGGETKRVTIFFSDIRAFTAISEKLTPHEVVEFLNQYMTEMVDCVEETGGVVDKFIGDAVMAVWGAPVSAGSPAADALACVKAALMMRAALLDFNSGRGGDKKPLIKIGCGINTGDVVAGQIGSSRRMEYTVIGDAVNLASRTEALNKPLHTDILITENTHALVGADLITEEMPPVSVKGKEKPVRMFAVINVRNPGDFPALSGFPAIKDGISAVGETGPKTLAQVRLLLGVDAPDLSSVDTNAEEQKYKIGE